MSAGEKHADDCSLRRAPSPASQYEGQFETRRPASWAQAVSVQVRRFGGLGAASARSSIRSSNPRQGALHLDGIPLTTAGRDVINLRHPCRSTASSASRSTAAPFRSAGADASPASSAWSPSADRRAAHRGLHLLRLLQHGEGQRFHGQSVGGYDLLGGVTYLHTDGDFEFPRQPRHRLRSERRDTREPPSTTSSIPSTV